MGFVMGGNRENETGKILESASAAQPALRGFSAWATALMQCGGMDKAVGSRNVGSGAALRLWLGLAESAPADCGVAQAGDAGIGQTASVIYRFGRGCIGL